MNFHLCDTEGCDKIAVWLYCPGCNHIKGDYQCDDHVPRGCDCNHIRMSSPGSELPTSEDEPYKWIVEGKVWTTLDSSGREFPCCEWGWFENGIEITDNE